MIKIVRFLALAGALSFAVIPPAMSQGGGTCRYTCINTFSDPFQVQGYEVYYTTYEDCCYGSIVACPPGMDALRATWGDPEQPCL